MDLTIPGVFGESRLGFVILVCVEADCGKGFPDKGRDGVAEPDEVCEEEDVCERGSADAEHDGLDKDLGDLDLGNDPEERLVGVEKGRQVSSQARREDRRVVVEKRNLVEREKNKRRQPDDPSIGRHSCP